MKNVIRLLLIPVFLLFAFQGIAQDNQDQPEQLNLPGDNLNLYAVMRIFQQSPTLEEFEKKLNDPDTKVNNLDLNGDNQTDYIKVVDNITGDVHNISLKVAVSADEDQDVAVFVVKKDPNGQVVIQLIGDEDLYGKNYIIEPNTGNSSATANPGYTGDQPPPAYDESYAVSSWPVIQYMYVPSYSVWVSPWRFGYYPSYWHPWSPLYWHEYYGYQYHWNDYYRAHYRYTPVYRVPAWRDHYYGGRLRSRSSLVEIRVNAGNYRQTYSRPDLATRGAEEFRRDHPTARSNDRPLPRFDNNNNNRPIVNRPTRDVNRPGNGRPFGDNNNGGNNNNNNNNFARPVNPNPSNANNNNNNNNGNNNNRPNRPAFSRPSDPNNANNGRPFTRPVNPNTNPGNPNVNNGNNNNNNNGNAPGRPSNRPAFTRPSDANNATPNRPFTRPVNPAPVNNNAPNRPVVRPANGNNFPNRPVDRPATPRPQQQVQRPADNNPQPRPGGDRPERDHHN